MLNVFRVPRAVSGGCVSARAVPLQMLAGKQTRFTLGTKLCLIPPTSQSSHVNIRLHSLDASSVSWRTIPRSGLVNSRNTPDSYKYH